MSNLAEVKQKTQNTNLATVDDYLKKNDLLIRRALQNTITPERFLAVTNIVMQSPALRGCSQESLVAAVLQTVQIGLTPGAIGHVHYVPFWNSKKNAQEVQIQIGYRGLVELVNRSKEASILNSEVVFANDEFQYEQGLNPILRHIPAQGDRGEMIGVYCIAKNMLANEKVFVYIPKEEVLKIKNESLSKVKPENQKYTPWVKWEKEMWQKTAVRRIVKLLPLSVEIQQKVGADETVKTSISQRMTDAPDKTDWNATDAEIVPQEETKTEDSSQQQKQPTVSTPEQKHLIDIPIGETLSEGEFLVHSVEFKDNVGKSGKSICHVEDAAGQEYYIQKWGPVKEDISGHICTFFLIKVAEYNEKRQYMADKVVIKE